MGKDCYSRPHPIPQAPYPIPSFVVALLACTLAAAGEGTLKGAVKYDGDPPPPKIAQLPADKKDECHCDQQATDELVVDKKTKGIRWAIVRIMGVKAPPPEKPFAEASIDQQGCRFVPHVVIIPPGTTLNVLNADKINHNFHTTPLDGANPGVNRMMQPDEQKMPLKGSKFFAESDLIKVQCDVHPWMSAFLVVHDPRFAAITGEDGSFEIRNIPAGKYDLSVFHELGEKKQNIEIKGGQTTEVGEVLFKPAK
jgi:plastocyanin